MYFYRTTSHPGLCTDCVVWRNAVARMLLRMVVVAVLLPNGVLAQAPPDYDFQWRTVGAPGNRATNSTENPFPPDPSLAAIGSVSYGYRMSRTEVTVSQWKDFVTAYRPFWPGSPSAPALTGDWIRWDGTQYTILPGAANYPPSLSRGAEHFAEESCSHLSADVARRGRRGVSCVAGRGIFCWRATSPWKRA